MHFGLSALGEHHQLQAQIADGAHEGLGADALAVFESRECGVGGTDDLGELILGVPLFLAGFLEKRPELVKAVHIGSLHRTSPIGYQFFLILADIGKMSNILDRSENEVIVKYF